MLHATSQTVLASIAGVQPGAMSLLAIFISTIAGLVLEPLPTGGVCFVALTLAVVTKTLKFQEAFAAFTNEARARAARFRARAARGRI